MRTQKDETQPRSVQRLLVAGVMVVLPAEACTATTQASNTQESTGGAAVGNDRSSGGAAVVASDADTVASVDASADVVVDAGHVDAYPSGMRG